MKDVAEAHAQWASPRVRHLLSSARDQFVKRGFDAVSIDSIARAASVSKETIYRHFADKEALFRAALDAQGAEFIARATAVHEGAATSGSELEGMARAILDSTLDQGMFSALWVAAGVAHKMPDLAATLHKGPGMRLEPVRQALEDHARERGIDRPVPLEIALDFGSLAAEGVAPLMGFPPAPPEARERIAHHVAALFVEGIGPASGGKRDEVPPPDSLPPAEVLPGQDLPSHIRTLLDVAGRNFLQQGYEGTNLNIIGEEARVGRGTLYRHFSSKAGLFAAAMRRLAQDCADQAAPPALPVADSRRAALTAFLEEALASLASPNSIHLHRAVISQSRRDAALARDVYIIVRAPWMEALADWLKSLGVREGADWYARQLLVLALRGTRLFASAKPVPAQERRRYAERAATIFLDGFVSVL